QAAEEARQAAEEEARLRSEAEARARERGEELEAVLALAQETEAKLVAAEAKFESELVQVAKATAAQPAQFVQATVARAAKAGDDLDLSEAETRKLVDQQLRTAGWEVDSFALTHAKGARPQK